MSAVSARVVSVNVTEPRVVSVKGRDVETSIFKRSAEGPVAVDWAGIVGERRISPRMCAPADHAIYVYPHEHYAAWETELGEGPFPLGQFGENLTVSGLSETTTRVGDVLACGAVKLRVRQPRLPCAKLNVRMGQRFAGRFLRSRRLGFFLSVLEPGSVRAGDAIALLERDEAAPTIDELIRLTQIDYWDTVGLEALVGCAQLPEPWRESIREKLDVARRADGWHGLRELEICGRQVECAGTVSLWLRCPHDRPLAAFRAGQHLSVAWREPEHVVTRRSYAITSSPRALDRYRVTVRLVPPTEDHPAGVVSSALHALGIGDRVRVAAPRGHVTLSEVPASASSLLFVSDVSGVPTAYALASDWAERLSNVPARYVEVLGSGEPAPLRQELRHIEARAPVERTSGPLESVLSDVTASHVFLLGTRRFVERVDALLGAREAVVAREIYGA